MKYIINPLWPNPHKNNPSTPTKPTGAAAKAPNDPI